MKRILLSIAILTAMSISAQQTEEKIKPTVVAECHTFTETAKLSDLIPLVEEADPDRIYEVPNKLRRYKHVRPANLPGGKDPVLQKQKASHWTKAPLQNWDGTNFSAYPPDPSGAAGPNHYVQMVNSQFTIYDKSGTVLYGPSNLGTLLGGGNDGDPIVMYDKDADRWFLSQFKQSNNSLQIAISQTPDPTGAYYSYEFSLNVFPDYPKYSVWSNAYFVSANKSAPQLYAMDRDKMLAGDPTATIQGFTVPSLSTNGFFSILPAHSTGTVASTSTPGYVFYFQDDGWAGVSSDHIKIWEVDLDWNNSSNSSISTPQQLAVSAFDSEFTTSWDDIEQPGTTDKLDGVPEAFMYMAHYREFSGYSSVVLNHTVDVDGTNHAGIRWYELRKVGSNPWTVYQEGTFAPDAESRWLGSICMDYQGNIGLAYSVSGPTVYPSIRYTGRYAADPLGTMTLAEEDIVVGSSAQTGPNRWGDYAQMTLDPVDDATFWYTGEYVATGGNRRTRIASFKIASDADDDLGVVAIVDPTDGTLSTTEAVTVTIYNYGVNDQSGFPVSYSLDGGTPVTETYSGTITSGSSAQHTFTTTVNLGTPGNYEIKAYTGLSADQYNPNDTTVKTVQHLFADNVGATAITSPSGTGSFTSTETVTITIENFGTSTQTSIPVAYQINGGTVVAETYNGSITAGGSDTYSFTTTADLSNLGSYTIVAYTDLSGDSDLTNDTTEYTITNEICQPTADCSSGDGLTKFKLNTINNNSGCSAGGYGDYTSQMTSLEQGATYNLQVQSGYDNQVVTVWIDFNDNFTFESSEMVITDQPFGSTLTTINFPISGTANLGQHLMRARTNWTWFGTASITDPCVDVSYGETEDYKVEINTFSGISDINSNGVELSIVEIEKNQFKVSLNGTVENTMIEVHNSIGQLISNENFTGTSDIINLSDYARGYYLIKVYGTDFSKVQKVFVK
ncbi:MAG: T9SS type A sorting domain-containing protein [Flavobacteriales bacterium]|nr:T9SS type A sorting domain-containing protein [Flavobacteriales bacterium]MCB9196267.1 T9SS type A sorting domain-containing protein [Flavobacteriales bacterium]MCB9198828.1 T9SS type A sorting domain-containing protein [Flavobacteriales bacterium]